MDAATFQTFQRVLRRTGCPNLAARKAGVPPSAIPRALRLLGRLAAVRKGAATPALRDAAADPADEGAAAVKSLEAEALRRAIHGVEVPVFHQGRECGSTVKHSDQLLIFLLKALRPERYAPVPARESKPGRRPVLLDIDLSAADADTSFPEDDEAPGG